MRLLRNKFVSATLSLIILQSVLFPSFSFALTGGDHQAEYVSYEDSATTDMVNLLTGDFNFNLPILNVPGPEGGFNLPLSYHAGIGPEQEASWTGLGWNINAGAIVRDINQYPDDASGQANTVTVQNLTGVYGYSVQWSLPYRQTWNSKEGSYGDVNLLDLAEFEWGNKHSVGIAGIHVDGQGLHVNAQQAINAALTIATLGTESSIEQTVKSASLQLAISDGLNFASSALSRPSAASSEGYYKSRFESHNSLVFSSKIPGMIGLKNSWRTWIDDTRQENMYGLLYLDQAPVEPIKTAGTVTTAKFVSTTVGLNLSINGTASPIVSAFSQSTDTVNKGAASDINFSLDNTQPYQSQNIPALLANDQYMVNAPGISGEISPYRLEVGSVSMPREMTEKHIRLSPVPFMSYGSGKVPFIYTGSATNEYFHHAGNQNSSPTVPVSNYGITKTNYSALVEGSITYPLTSADLNDYVFFNEKVAPAYTSQKSIAQENYVNWLTNDEIKNGVTYSSGFLDFLPGGANSFRYNFRNAISNSIGGYSITSADGKTYHFALPVYAKNEFTKSTSATDPNKSTSISRPDPFAVTWLLTAITGPDFIDRNQNGMADINDWGYWVKFNYGKDASAYDWRSPYSGTSPDPTGAFVNYSTGQREVYYLNSIETRSHVALFFKSSRNDGLSVSGAYSQLELDEICLLKREDYLSLVASGLGDFSSTYALECLSSLITSSIRTFINGHALKRVLFSYDYSLCKQTPNTDATKNPLKGKLTLNRLSIRGRNDAKVAPDYLFEYANNPDYNSNYWDGWGMYNSTATATSHKASTVDSDASVWSLTRITTPLGSTIDINYEHDSYSSISGQPVSDDVPIGFTSSAYSISYSGPGSFSTVNGLTNLTGLSVGDRVQLSGSAEYTCPGSTSNTDVSYGPAVYTITAINNTYPYSITLSDDYPGVQCDNLSEGNSVVFQYNAGLIKRLTSAKPGGNERVSMLTLNDQGKAYKTRYVYTNDDHTSSGVVAQEPAFIKSTDLSFYKYINYPVTPVLYSKVTVLKGLLNTDSDFDTKTVYNFETPSAVTLTQGDGDNGSITNICDFHLFTIQDRSARIGRLNGISVYDKSNASPSSQTNFLYSEQIPNNANDNYQGIYSQSTLLVDMFNGTGKTIINPSGGGGYDYVYLPDHVRLNRTTMLRYPWVLKKVVTQKDGLLAESENLKWDFISGTVLEKINRSSLGVNVKTVVVPAYQQYPSLGSKAIDQANNKNMLTQLAATYVYKTDVQGNPFGLLSAQAQTWSNNWNYRVNTSGTYGDQQEGTGVWRVGKTYQWKGTYDRLQQSGGRQDGIQSFGGGDQFNFATGAANTGWLYAGETSRYDHYSMPLEAKNVNGLFSSAKMDFAGQYRLATASNANYFEIAYSGAEDLDPSSGYFGGEVAAGSGITVTTAAHTGASALSLGAGLYGFVYKPSLLRANHIYRVSAWTNSINGQVYYKLNSGGEVDSPVSTRSAYNSLTGTTWYQVNLEIPVGASFSALEVGVKSASGTVLFDDFRFQPLDAAVAANVYDPATGALTWVLDNQNMFTQYQYNDQGQLIKTYRESFAYGVKLISESKVNYRRFITNP